jgi:hypothetical protein
MAEVIDICRGPAAFPCGSWWANATLALPVLVFFAEWCPLRCRASTTAEGAGEVVQEGARSATAAADDFLIELVETWTTSRILRVGADGACEVVYEGAKRRGPWRAVAFHDDEPPALPAEPTGDAGLDALVAQAKSLPEPAPARAERAPQP